jgi:molybdate transport system substrate-binding protein
MIKIFIPLMLITSSLIASTISIAVSANASYVIDSLVSEFSKIAPKTKIRVTLGSSGKLVSMINNGAPYHLFMSANMSYPQALYNKRRAITEPVIYAKGSLSYFSKTPRDFKDGIRLLKSNSIIKIAVANPKTAPYGKATQEALKSAGIYHDISHKFVYGESISQTVTYAVNATDIGIIATSALYASSMREYKEGVNWSRLNLSLYQPIKQGVVLLKYAKKSQEAREFYDFLLSKKAKKIFNSYGYITDE